ncbi:MAG: hypothetical protein K9J13_13880 [Saprospiraceae bacterium]|nr:hypothetical protein [Saprospiraceae bacterium]
MKKRFKVLIFSLVTVCCLSCAKEENDKTVTFICQKANKTKIKNCRIVIDKHKSNVDSKIGQSKLTNSSGEAKFIVESDEIYYYNAEVILDGNIYFDNSSFLTDKNNEIIIEL